MAINWQMGVSDPMQGINLGLASLGQALQAQKAQERQAAIDAQNMQMNNMQMTRERMTLEDMARKRQQEAGLRSLMANPQTVPATPGVSNISQPSPGIQGLSGLAAMGGADFTGRGAAPAPTMKDPTQGAASPAGFTMEQPQPTAGPQVGATNEGVTPGTEAKQASPERIAYQYYSKNDPAKAKELRKETIEEAEKLAKMGYHSKSIDLIRDTLGLDVKYVGSKDNIFAYTYKGVTTLKDVVSGQMATLGTPEVETKVLGEGGTLVDEKGNVIATGQPKAGKPFERKYEEGDTLVTELYDAQGKLTETKKAPRYKPPAPPTDKTDPIVAREVVKDLPKLRREANTAVAAKSRLDQMIGLMDKGSAGGLKGTLLNTVSGIFDVPATSEADLFKKLASAGAGQLRATVIGPGQVSNYEQKLLQSVSGGGSGARTAVRELLLFYKQEADRTIGNYNDSVDSAASVAPSVSKGFRKIGGQPSGGKKSDPLGIR